MTCKNCEGYDTAFGCGLFKCNNILSKRLAAYEDAEEQGLLVRLPCKVGDMVYYKRRGWVCGDTVKIILFDAFGYHVRLDYEHKEFDFEDFGKTVFASREEAEAALKGDKE